MGEKLSFKEATDKHMGIILNEISRTQSNYWTFRTFTEEVAKLENKGIATVLNKVNVFYGLMKILET
jgi:acyl-CoA oxidase